MSFPTLQNVCMDGEVRPMMSCDIEVVPSALRFVVPEGSTPIRLPDYISQTDDVPLTV